MHRLVHLRLVPGKVPFLPLHLCPCSGMLCRCGFESACEIWPIAAELVSVTHEELCRTGRGKTAGHVLQSVKGAQRVLILDPFSGGIDVGTVVQANMATINSLAADGSELISRFLHLSVTGTSEADKTRTHFLHKQQKQPMNQESYVEASMAISLYLHKKPIYI